MLLIQDIQVVIGREEVPFDDAYRDELAPRIADDAGTRLAGFLWAPHGAGEGYEAVTLTAVADVDALDRHQRRFMADGDLADLWVGLEAKRRSLQSTLHEIAEWSPMIAGGLDGFAVGDHPTAMYRLDSFAVEGAPADAVDDVERQHRATGADTTAEVVGCWWSYLGELETPVVSVLSRVRSNETLREAFTKPFDAWTGIPELRGARRMTRMLRSTVWSPLS